MNTKLYIGNLKWNIDSDWLRLIFSEIGRVVSADIIKDRETGRSRGFGFIQMSTEEDTRKAIDLLHGTSLEGRNMVVKVAEPENKNKLPARVITDLMEYIGKAQVSDKYDFWYKEKHFVVIRDGETRLDPNQDYKRQTYKYNTRQYK